MSIILFVCGISLGNGYVAVVLFFLLVKIVLNSARRNNYFLYFFLFVLLSFLVCFKNNVFS